MAKAPNEKLTDAILEILDGGTYTLWNGNTVQGQTLSYLHGWLRDDGWKNLGGLHTGFDELLGKLGFKVVEGRNSRGQKCQVVTL